MIRYTVLALARLDELEESWSEKYLAGVKAQIELVEVARAMVGKAVECDEPDVYRTRYRHTWIFYQLHPDYVLIVNLNDTSQEHGGKLGT